MRRPRRFLLPAPAVAALLLAGCDANPGGPSIPPIPRAAEPGASPSPAITTAPTKPGQRSIFRKQGKTQTAPRSRREPE